MEIYNSSRGNNAEEEISGKLLGCAEDLFSGSHMYKRPCLRQDFLNVHAEKNLILQVFVKENGYLCQMLIRVLFCLVN